MVAEDVEGHCSDAPSTSSIRFSLLFFVRFFVRSSLPNLVFDEFTCELYSAGGFHVDGRRKQTREKME